MEPSLPSIVLAVVLMAGLPLLTTGEEAVEEAFREVSDRRPLYASAALSLILVAGVTWGVAAWAGLRGDELGWRAGEPGRALGWAAGVTAAGLGMVWATTRLARRLGWRESRAVLFLLPRDRREKGWFLLLALAAAVGEEYVYRGFAFHVLEAWTGGPGPALAVTTVSFGLAHGYQRAAGVLRAMMLGGFLALPVVATGSILPSVVAHFWINAIIGLGGWRWLAPELEPGPDAGEPGEPTDGTGGAGTERDAR